MHEDCTLDELRVRLHDAVYGTLLVLRDGQTGDPHDDARLMQIEQSLGAAAREVEAGRRSSHALAQPSSSDARP